MQQVSITIDSINSLMERCKNETDKVERDYNSERQKALRNANTGFTLAGKEYIKIQTCITVQAPFSKDSLAAVLMDKSNSFKKLLVYLYHHDDEMLKNRISQFHKLSASLKKEKKTTLKTIQIREMAYTFRHKVENRRYIAYDRLITGIINNMRILKTRDKKKQ